MPVTKHGLTKHKLFKVWCEMRNRTNNPLNKNFCKYGGRGIIVCDEWKNDFKSFYDWAMSNGYKEDLSIDRINNDGNYEPSNCRYVNQSVQMSNTRAIKETNTTGFRGVSFYSNLNKYRVQVRYEKKYKHLGYFENAIDGAMAFDKYVIDNNLEHTTNGLYKKEIF